MSRVIQGLRSNVTDEDSMKGINALSVLLKAWQKDNYANSLQIIRKSKIPWSSVLFKGAPTKVIKGKKNKPDQTVVRSPPKPSKSPWLSQAERSEYGNLYKDLWSGADSIRDRWNALDSMQQHSQFNGYIAEVKRLYETLNNVSNSTHSKLGKRKCWIEQYCKESNFKPKPKRDEAESFLLSTHFFSKDHSNMSNNVKKIFAPITVFGNLYKDIDQATLWSTITSVTEGDRHRITSADFTAINAGELRPLWQIWADVFKPVFTRETESVEEAQLPTERNMFARLLGLGQD
jgi:hypothetical protein